jgi:1-acyl-sn-glycerol-3-phosphate acyltransferase
MRSRDAAAPDLRRLDEFGFDPAFRTALDPVLRWVSESVFRTRVVMEGPSDWRGPVVFVANHGGFLPIDAIVAKTVLEPLVEGRRLRPLLENYVFTLPWVGLWASRLGCVRASQENAVRLLSRGESVLAFPEGVRGAGRTLFERGKVLRFGRGGLVRLALRTGTQVVPVAIRGPDEAYPLLARSAAVGKLLDLPFLPVTPTFPWLGPLGLVPLPARFDVVVGEAIDLEGLAGKGPHDDACINRVNEHVRARVLELVGRARGGA